MPRGSPKRCTDVQVIAAMEQASGNMAHAAKILGLNRTTLYLRYVNKSPALQERLAEFREKMLDDAESALYRAVLAGEAWAVCFFLKTQGKRRGYVERQELTGADGGPIRSVMEDASDDLVGRVAGLVARATAGRDPGESEPG